MGRNLAMRRALATNNNMAMRGIIWCLLWHAASGHLLLCTVAFYWRVGTAPPQYEDFSGANGYPADCPPSAEMEPPEEAEAAPPSPIERAAAVAAVRLPDV